MAGDLAMNEMGQGSWLMDLAILQFQVMVDLELELSYYNSCCIKYPT